MRHFVIAFVFFCTWLYFGVQYYECNVKKLCEVSEPITAVEPPKVVEQKPLEKPLTYLPFSIVKNSETVRLVDSISNPLQVFFDFLNSHQQKELVITSFFSKDESGTIAFSRNESLLKVLTDFGLNPDRIVMQTKQGDFKFLENDQFEKGFAYEYQTMSVERMNAMDKGIATKILYAGFGSKTFQPDNTLSAYSLELKNYLAKHPDTHVEIIGHTDNNGDLEANEWIGQERAKSVMEYFVSQGIDATKLTISSKGETSPIATNATLEGRRLNRRIEINITN